MEIEDVQTIAPLAVERARRLAFAKRLIRVGTPKRDATAMVRQKFRCSQPTAWRVVDAAFDLVGVVNDAKR